MPSILRALAGLGLALVAITSAGCPAKIEVEGKSFPCRGPADCIDGFECHPTRWVCVPRGSVVDAGLPLPPPPQDAEVITPVDAEPALDAEPDAAPDASVADTGLVKTEDAALPDAEAPPQVGLGEACGERAVCGEGFCVDGYCCESECTEVCHRCDQTPGRCLPVPDGTDPDNECVAEYECSDYTYGVMDGVCYAAPTLHVSNGTCSVLGACRPRGCRNNGVGREISRCGAADCLIDGACPYGARITLFDEVGELCRSGREEACTTANGGAGCCSALGACCEQACMVDSGGAAGTCP